MAEEEVKVRRANVILRVPKEQVKEYLAKGFDVLDDNGNVAQASVPNDVNVLKQAYIEHTNRIKELEELLDAVKKVKATPKKEPSTAKTTKAKSTKSKE